jgi:hypothetical protein
MTPEHGYIGLLGKPGTKLNGAFPKIWGKFKTQNLSCHCSEEGLISPFFGNHSVNLERTYIFHDLFVEERMPRISRVIRNNSVVSSQVSRPQPRQVQKHLAAESLGASSG